MNMAKPLSPPALKAATCPRATKGKQLFRELIYSDIDKASAGPFHRE